MIQAWKEEKKKKEVLEEAIDQAGKNAKQAWKSWGHVINNQVVCPRDSPWILSLRSLAKNTFQKNKHAKSIQTYRLGQIALFSVMTQI